MLKKQVRLAVCRSLWIVGLVLAGQSVQAKNLNQRLGIGFKNNTSVSVPSLAVQYYPSAEYALTGGVGMDTEKDNSKFQLHVGAKKMMFLGTEQNMNFFFGGQIGTLTNEVASTKETGVEIQAVIGGEFFFQGLDSLSFTFEAGVGMSNLDSARFRTIGNDPFKAGILFYF